MFDLGAATGTVVGFWSPLYVGHGLTVPGFHLHFLTGARRMGGHAAPAGCLARNHWAWHGMCGSLALSMACCLSLLPSHLWSGAVFRQL